MREAVLRVFLVHAKRKAEAVSFPTQPIPVYISHLWCKAAQFVRSSIQNAILVVQHSLPLSIPVNTSTMYVCMHVSSLVLKARRCGGSSIFVGLECLSRQWVGFPLGF